MQLLNPPRQLGEGDEPQLPNNLPAFPWRTLLFGPQRMCSPHAKPNFPLCPV